jgi:chromosome segregation ATPase
VESLQSNVQQIESSVQARQAGIYEQIRELREEQARLDRLLEEGARQDRGNTQQLERLREKTAEDFEKRDRAQREALQADTEQLARLNGRLDTLQKGLLTVNDNLVAMSDFEKKQEERIARIQEQFQGQLKVVVEEVGRDNQELSRGLAAARADLEVTRQEVSGVRQGLLELQRPMQEIAAQLAALQTQMQDVAKRQEAQRKAAPARGGGEQHTVRPGETLTAIAARYGVSVRALLDKNGLADADSIREGQKLTIPER